MLELIIFIVATFIYSLARYFLDPKYFRVIIGVYVSIILITQFYFNIDLLGQMCGGNSSNFGMAALVTFVPWIFIGGGIVLGIMTFPGWKQPFSNTFGYGIAKLAGLNSVLYKLLKNPNAGGNKLKKTLHNIYSDPSLFINQITPDNFGDFMKASQFLFVPNAANKPEMRELYKLIELKDIVAEFIWYLLTGVLINTVSYNTIASSNCTNSVKEMKKRHDEYEKDVKESQEEQKSAPAQRVYKIYD